MKLFYYTTTETMKYIVTGGNIYATNVGYMNDSDEYSNGLRELKHLLEKNVEFDMREFRVKNEDLDDIYTNISTNTIDIYSISFSKASDLLSQWHMYAKESGVQIELNFEKDCDYSYYDGRPVQDLNSIICKKRLEIKDVYYLTQIGMPPKEYKKTGKEILEEFNSLLKSSGKDIDDEMQNVWRKMAPYIKNYGFRQEEEVRVIIEKDNESHINYRNDRGVLKPYLDIRMQKGWPICGIMVGPGKNQAQVFKSICHFLENTELNLIRQEYEMLVEKYFEGMKEYTLPEDKIDQCKVEVMGIDPKVLRFGATYSQKIKEVLEMADFNEAEKRIVDQYQNDNYFCDKGIIVSKSKWPYEF